MKKTLVTLAVITMAVFNNNAGSIGVETLGLIRNLNIHDGVDYGAGLGVKFGLNSHVTLHARAFAFEHNNWKGSLVDYGSALVEAKLLGSENKKFSLSAIGGANRNFETDDWSLSIGPRVSYALTKKLSLVAETQIEVLINGGKNLNTVVGLGYSF